MDQPLVSVLLSTYNRLDLLKICLNSILSQNYCNLDIVIFNDCSNDGTEEYLNGLNDKRLNIFNSQKNIVQTYGHTKVWLKMLEINSVLSFIFCLSNLKSALAFILFVC